MENLLAKQTKCLLAQPSFSSNGFLNFSDVARFVGAKYPAAPLGLMTVAALLPQHWEFRLVDENVRPLRDADLEWADIVLTGGMLPQQKGILTTIKWAHNMGKPVVVGGPDVTSQPSLYETADFLVLGEGEITIPPFLDDIGKGVTSGIYQSDLHADMTKAVVPRFDLIRFGDYMRLAVQFSRGCPFSCEFCDIIELFGRRPRTKTPEQMVSELQALYDLGYRGHVDLVDDNFIGNKAKVVEVLQAIAEWSKRHRYPFYFSTEASINLAKEEKLLQLMQQNDFRYVFVGIESPDEDVLTEARKTQNKRVSVVDAVRTLTAHGMIVNGGFILGFDNETEHTAGNMIDLVQETGICMALLGTLVALPNTQLSRRLQREGRLFDGGQVRVDGAGDIDQTTSGLNFVTRRPRTAILQDQAHVLRNIYDPVKYYERVLCTATYLVPSHRYRPGLARTLKLAWAFLKVSVRAGFDARTGLLYWRTLLQVLLRNPRALDVVVNLSALYVHFGEQSEFVIRMVGERVDCVDRYGEESYNRWMILGDGLPEVTG
jgi:radical SAM superfamily enzyme YgiQ (UPF0313 family)